MMPDFSEKSRIAYDQKADRYDDSPEGRFTRGFQRLLIPLMTWRADQRVLDVGCGTGSLLEALNAARPIRGFGVDVSERMIERAARRCPGMEFHAAGCDATPFPDGSMDIVTTCAAYHHFPDPAAFAAEARRVLAPNGMVYIADIHYPSWLRLLLNPFVPLLKDGDVRLYAPAEIIRNFRRFGFETADARLSGHVQIVSARKA